MKVVCDISWRTFDEDYNFALDLTSNRGLKKTLWTSKIMKVPILRISKLPNPKQNDIWVQAMWPIIENTIKGKVMASPKFKP